MKLNVTEVVRNRALTVSFLAFHIRPGGRVFYADLERIWRVETGLRHRDLQRSLAELAGRGGLRFHEGAHGRLVELTERGARELDAPMMTLSDLWRQLHAHWVLSRARRRYRRTPAALPAAPTRRRAEDCLLLA